MFDLLLVPLVVLLGLGVGGGVGAVAVRLAARRPLWAAPACLLTGAPLTGAERLPVLGYLRRRGRCRHCGRRLPGWVPWTEAGMAAWALAAYAVAGPSPRFLILVAEGAVLLTLLVMDWRRHDIYTVVLLAGAAVALLGAPFLPEIGLVKAVAGGLAGGLVMLLLWAVGNWLGRALYGKPGLAFGDVELGVLIGLMCGWPGVIAALFWGPVLGGVLAVGFLLTRKKGLRDYFPYGPGLCLAAGLYVLLHASPFSLPNLLPLDLITSIFSAILAIVGKLAVRLFGGQVR